MSETNETEDYYNVDIEELTKRQYYYGSLKNFTYYHVYFEDKLDKHSLQHFDWLNQYAVISFKKLNTSAIIVVEEGDEDLIKNSLENEIKTKAFYYKTTWKLTTRKEPPKHQLKRRLSEVGERRNLRRNSL